MRLDALTASLGPGTTAARPGAQGDVEVTGLAYDSRMVKPGDLFFCVGGFRARRRP